MKKSILKIKPKLTDNKFDQDIKKIKNSINQLRDCYIEKVYPS